MLTFYRGSRLELLADRLVELLRSEPLEEPLAPEILIVQNHGMARWLSTYMAAENGIAANLKFPFPAEKIWDIYRFMDESIPKKLPSDREPMTWSLYGLLEELPEKAPFLSVWHYMRDDRGKWNSLKAWKLANEIGNIFDKYLNYRHEMLIEWQNGTKNTGFGASEAWQSALWQRLNSRWREQAVNTDLKWHHQVGIHEAFMGKLRAGTLPSDNLPGRLVVFGLSGLQPSYIEVLVNISRLVDVHWFWMDPAVEHQDQPLIDSWGGEGRDFLSLFYHYCETGDIKIREAVVAHSSPAASDFRSPVSDIQIHSCHSPLREVEVLYDRLLDLFDKNPDLTPDDILIMTPDIETYAPFIEAVFATPEEGLPYLPFHVVDEQTGVRKEVFQTFSNLLHILDSRFKVTEVLDLLSSRALLEKFDIGEDELERINRWIADTKIRWGIDGEHKQQMELPNSRAYTWQFGIDRMLLGLSSHADDAVFQDIYPFDRIESNDDAALLGKLSRFLGELREARGQSLGSHTPERWVQLLNRWITAFIPADRLFHGAFRGLTELVLKMKESTTLGAFKNRMGFSVVLQYMDERLAKEAGRGGYFGHGITFSGLDPMRNIPYRVIGMIGMNNESFPRRKISPDFDLMSREPKPGDRSRRNDDRYLFLETMHSASQLFYLSYVGQSNRDDSSRPPSVMISELVDHLSEIRGIQQDEMVLEHPLHAYSSRYFNRGDEEGLFSYSGLRYEVSRRIAAPEEEPSSFWNGSLPEAEETFRQLSLGDLARFFENPSRYLLQQRLGLYFREDEIISDDREPFELGGLEGYKLSEELLMRTLDNRDLADYEPIARAKGLLPEGLVGEQVFREKAEEVREFRSSIGQILRLPKRDSVEISLEIGDFYLTGLLDSLNSQYQFFLRYGSLRAKDLSKLWIYHLALQQVPDLNHPYRSILATRDKKQPAFCHFSRIENADRLLHNLLQLYWEGIHSKIPFFSDSSFSYAHEVLVRNKPHEAALDNARRQWFNSWRPYLSEREDPYIKLLYKGSEPIETEEFTDFSLKFWKPVFEFLNKEEDGVA